MAATNTIWELRRIFPGADLPEITIEAVSPIQRGEEFEVEAWITSMENLSEVQLALGSGKLLRKRKTEFSDGYKGQLTAGEPVILRAAFLANEVGRTQLVLSVRINHTKIDKTMYRVPLYIEIQEHGGTARMTPFEGLDEVSEHLIQINHE
jgi:hypothetical protein